MDCKHARLLLAFVRPNDPTELDAAEAADLHLHLDVLLKTDALLALFALTLWRPAAGPAAERYQPPTAAPSTGRTKASEGSTPSRR